MNNVIISFALLLCIGCATDNQQTNTTKVITKAEMFKVAKTEKLKTVITTVNNEGLNISDELYDLQFKIEKTADNKHSLVIAIKLHNGASFISPFETKEFLGKFYMDLGSFKDLSFDENIIETPQAVAEYDGFENAPVIWVKENTTYKQSLNILSENDFEVLGRLKFTIEPRCSLEEIPFGILYKDGKMTIFSAKC